ncbi:MAG: LTA synthase family protein [Desulfobulbaceae bacterium]|nr:MAG: LTA synthase family protein [Desulfobulbaceae bacterium]
MTRIQILNNRLFLSVLAVPSFLPFLWRLFRHGLAEPAGLLSDCAFGLAIYLLALSTPRILRLLPLLLWGLFQAGSQELHAAMQRLPSWQDLQYLTDPAFIGNSAAGLHLAYPGYAALLLVSATAAALVKGQRPGRTYLVAGPLAIALLLAVQSYVSGRDNEGSIASRYNPLHWFISDAAATSFQPKPTAMTVADLPPTLRQLDFSGTSLLKDRGRARNVLIVVLEGIPGLYHPDIRKAFGIADGPYQMEGLAATTADASLVPDFVAHSHQTIRGLYSMLCGDFSKFSYDMSKAFELQYNPQRAGECLPAQMAANGWETHYLQGAGLSFMGKDQVMPNIGFQQVHGNEWFSEPDPYPFMWGKTDPVFFRGARNYIADLQSRDKPWMLTLLTVGTHQPYAAPDEIVASYPNRMIATVAILDQAVAEFLKGIKEDGVLEDTLVIVTSDESHGDDIGEWVSSWGLMAILAPEGRELPRIKGGSYGLVDIQASIHDYLGLPAPSSLIGRSMFREYRQPREMISYTNSKLRWHTSDGRRYECSRSGGCSVGDAPSLLGPLPEAFSRDPDNSAPRLYALAAVLDHKLASQEQSQTLRFANGEIRRLPDKITNEWTDNLAGAQYLDFPAGSKVHVSIRIKALQTPAEGIQLKLFMRQFENLVGGIDYPPFPVLHAGEEGRVEFDIDNPQARQSFSFHLVGEGKGAEIRMEEFNVTIERQQG